MKYGLDDLKSVGDECMHGLCVSPAAQSRMVQKCFAAGSANRSNRRRSALYCASGVAACVAAACLITAALRTDRISTPIPSDAGYANSAAMSISPNSFVRVASQPEPSPTSAVCNGYTLVQNEQGLWGLKDPDGNWVVTPQYTTAYFENTTAYFTSEAASQVYAIPTVSTGN